MKKSFSLLFLLLFINTVAFADSCSDFQGLLPKYNVLIDKLIAEKSRYIAAKGKFDKDLSVNSSLAIKKDDYKYAYLIHSSMQEHIKTLKASALIVEDAYTDLDIMELQALDVESYCVPQVEKFGDGKLKRASEGSINLLIDIEDLVEKSEKTMKLLSSYLKL